MIYLSGAVYAPVMQWKHGGIMLTPEMGNNPNLDGVKWGADNGCYSAAEKFSVDKWTKFLEKQQGKGQCLFAVAPDIPFKMNETWKRSEPLLPLIRELGYLPALAIQNGVDIKTLKWDMFDAVFIAGTKQFKTSREAYQVAIEAKKRGLWVHVARRNSYRALQEAYDMEADSVDGTFLAFGPDKNFRRVQNWFDRLCTHPEVQMWDDKFGRCIVCKRELRRMYQYGR